MLSPNPLSVQTSTPDTDCFYVLNGAFHGPVSESELDSLHATGTLRDTTQVRTGRDPSWRPYVEWRAAREISAIPSSASLGTGKNGGSDDTGEENGPRHTCVACRKDWPESLMLVNNRRWLCRSCFYQQAMNARRKPEKVRRDWWKWLRERWRSAVTLLVVLGVTGFLAWHYRRELPFDFFDEEEPAEAWVKLPPTQWPQLVLTNRADFRGHSPLRGSSVFFVRRGDGTVVAATAAHLLTADAGVVPDMAPSELETALRGWWAYPPGAPEQAVALTGLDGSPATLRGFDMMFLRAGAGADKNVAVPLRLARREARGGQKVFVLGPVSDTRKGPRQNVFPGYVHVKNGGGKKNVGDGTLLDVHVDPIVTPTNLGGAPVIDERGHLVGLVKGWGDPVDAAGRVNTVVAQGSAAFRELLEPKEKKGVEAKAAANSAAAQAMERQMKKLLE